MRRKAIRFTATRGLDWNRVAVRLQWRQNAIASPEMKKPAEVLADSGRRTFLTSLANKGTAIHILKILAGHRNIATTAAYLYSSPAQLRAAVELV